MINRIIKASFSIVGAVTGFTLINTFLFVQNVNMQMNFKIAIFLLSSLASAVLFYLTANQIIIFALNFLDKVEMTIQKMTLLELTVSAAGLIVGLVVANLISIPLNRIDVIGLPLTIIVNVFLGCIGIAIALGKRNESLYSPLSDKKGFMKGGKGAVELKLLDTSVIIDGRIVDICRIGFLEGELVIPSFVLEELRHIADSQDAIKRNRGKRGLDVLNILQKELEYPVRIENMDIDGAEVDDKLLKAAKKLGGKIITNDYNLNKVASLHGIPVLNINELANAMKPIALPGEEMIVQVIKDGKENGQGIGYMDDGTMIVVEGGKKHVGETVSVMVTSVIQTAAGRMIFAKPKNLIERAI